MNNLLEKYEYLILTANPHYNTNSSNFININDDFFILEFKNNSTFRLVRGDYNSIYYDSYGEYLNYDDNKLILEFTDLEQDFHSNKKIYVKQILEYKIIQQETIIQKNNQKYKSNYTIVFNKQPDPLNYEINIENVFYCNLELL